MVYESDFYTTRRPYRPSPSLSSYTVSVHVVHSYDRIIPYIGHKRLTVIPSYGAPHVFRVRPSVIVREMDRIMHKPRPYLYYTPSLVHSEPLAFFDSEASLIRAQTKMLLRTIHAPVPRVRTPWSVAKIRYQYELPLPSRITSDDYIHRMLTPIKSVKQDIYNISHFVTEPLRRYIGPSHFACVRYGGDRAYSRRRNLTLQEIYAMQSDTVRNDIQLLSYYITINKDRKAREAASKASGNLDAMRPSRHFNKPQLMLEPSVSEEVKELREQRAERLRKIQELEDSTPAPVQLEAARTKRATKKQEEERLAEERALAEEKAKKEAAAKKEAEARRAELARQEALAAQAAADRQAELERKAAEEKAAAEKAAAEKAAVEKAAAEKAAAEAAEKAAAQAAEKAAADKAAAEAAEKAKLEEEKRQEEERQALLRLEEIARQAEEEKERELARQAEELAELARQEAELVEQAKREAELAELAKQEVELAELERQEKELAELDRQDREAAEAAKQESEMADQATEEAEVAAAESNIPAEEIPAEDEPETCEPEPVASPEPVIEEPDTPEVQEEEE